MNRAFNPTPRLLLALVLVAGAQVNAQGRKPAAPLPPRAVPRAVTVDQYRQFLEAQKQSLNQIEKRAPRDVSKVLKALDSGFIVKRGDGATQQTEGDLWNKTLALPNGKNFKNLTKRDVAALSKNIEAQISALNEWNSSKNGTYFVNADAKTIVTQLEQSGQIRTGPQAWQLAIANGRRWLGDQWDAFIKWLESLRPTRTAPVTGIPDMSWLWPVFWVCVVAMLGAIFFLVFRSLGGMEWMALRRRPKRETEFEGEDAQLLKLPPDELRERAEAFARKGNYREALRHRFLAILVNFDARGVWRYDLRRTNWEHIAGLRRQDAWRGLVTPLSDLTRRFDRVRYGGGLCEENEWLQFNSDATRLEEAIPKTTAAPAPELAGAAR